MTLGIPNNVLYGMALLLVIGLLCVVYAYYTAKQLTESDNNGIDKSNQRGTTHVTSGGENVFLDLGFEPDEAEALLLESRRRIATKQQAGSSKA